MFFINKNMSSVGLSRMEAIVTSVVRKVVVYERLLEVATFSSFEWQLPSNAVLFIPHQFL